MSQSVKAPFKFSYTQPSLDWFETMKSFETMCADDFCSYGEPKEGANADDHD